MMMIQGGGNVKTQDIFKGIRSFTDRVEWGKWLFRMISRVLAQAKRNSSATRFRRTIEKHDIEEGMRGR